MGYQDREYNRESFRSQLPRWQPPPRATLVLLLIHGVTCAMMLGSIWTDPQTPLWMLQLGEPRSNHLIAILTHPYATHSLGLALAYLGLLTVGAALEEREGAERMLRLYFVANLFAGTAYFLSARTLTMPENPLTLSYPLGALAAFTYFHWSNPHYRMVSVFGRLMGWHNLVALVAVVIAFFTVLGFGSRATGWVVAAIAGLLAVPVEARLPRIRFRLPSTRRRPRVVRPSVPKREAARPPTRADGLDDDLDALLAKISDSGLESLTDEERGRLEAHRRRRDG